MPARAARLLASAAVAIGLALSEAGCKTTGDDITGLDRRQQCPTQRCRMAALSS
jgi:hypothetical protein